jgi:hypothetical protein
VTNRGERSRVRRSGARTIRRRLDRAVVATTLTAGDPTESPCPEPRPEPLLFWTLEATMHAMIVNADTQLPEELRRALNLRPGQAVALIPESGVMRIVPVPTLEELCGVLEGVDTHEVREHAGSPGRTGASGPG